MTITITAFERSPDGGKGLARDTRVRWALEEVEQPCEVRLVSFAAMKEPAHLALHPFGQIPTYEEGSRALSPGVPRRRCDGSVRRTRATSWGPRAPGTSSGAGRTPR